MLRFELQAECPVTGARAGLLHSQLNGDPHMFTPESTVDVQLAFGSDIAMVLDECLGYPATHLEAKVSMDRTIRWARKGCAHFKHRMEDIETVHALFPIVQ